MRRSTATLPLLLALSVLGCTANDRSGTRVPLLTGVIGCYAGGEGGFEDVLLPDPTWGTTFGGRPVMWPNGFTGALLADGQVAVFDGTGAHVATTGNRYFISIALPGDFELMNKLNAYPAAAGCPYPHDFVAR